MKFEYCTFYITAILIFHITIIYGKQDPGPVSVFQDPGDVGVLTTADFDAELKKNRWTLVLFYVTGSQETIAVWDMFKGAATLMKDFKPDPVVFKMIDCEPNKTTCDGQGATTYPAFKIYSSGKFSMNYIPLEKTKEDMALYMEAVATPAAG